MRIFCNNLTANAPAIDRVANIYSQQISELTTAIVLIICALKLCFSNKVFVTGNVSSDALECHDFCDNKIVFTKKMIARPKFRDDHCFNEMEIIYREVCPLIRRGFYTGTRKEIVACESRFITAS